MATSSTSYPSSPSSPDDSLSPMSGSTPMASSPSSSASSSARPELMERVVQSAHDTVDKLADKARPQVQRLQETASSASDSLHARADQARELGDEWAESLRATVREHPLAALGTALAIGIVVARLSR